MSKFIVKPEYQAPHIEVLEARMERGFQASGGSSGSSAEGIGAGANYGADSFSPVSGGGAEGIGSGNSYDGAMFS